MVEMIEMLVLVFLVIILIVPHDGLPCSFQSFSWTMRHHHQWRKSSLSLRSLLWQQYPPLHQQTCHPCNSGAAKVIISGTPRRRNSSVAVSTMLQLQKISTQQSHGREDQILAANTTSITTTTTNYNYNNVTLSNLESFHERLTHNLSLPLFHHIVKSNNNQLQQQLQKDNLNTNTFFLTIQQDSNVLNNNNNNTILILRHLDTEHVSIVVRMCLDEYGSYSSQRNNKNKKKKHTTTKSNNENMQVEDDDVEFFFPWHDNKDNEHYDRHGSRSYNTISSLFTKSRMPITTIDNSKDAARKQQHQLPKLAIFSLLLNRFHNLQEQIDNRILKFIIRIGLEQRIQRRKYGELQKQQHQHDITETSFSGRSTRSSSTTAAILPPQTTLIKEEEEEDAITTSKRENDWSKKNCVTQLPDHNVLCLEYVDHHQQEIIGIAEISIQPPYQTAAPFVIPMTIKETFARWDKWRREGYKKLLINNNNQDENSVDEEQSISACHTLLEAYVSNVLIKQSHRGKGYGKLLMMACEGQAKNMGYDSLTLHVDADVRSGRVAQRLYLGMGYEPIVGNTLHDELYSWMSGAQEDMGISCKNNGGIYFIDGVPLLYLKKKLK